MTFFTTEVHKFAQNAIDLAFWSSYIEQEVGFVLPSAQKHWLVNSVLAVMNELGISEASLIASLDNSFIRQKLIDAILIPETRFFRDTKVVDFVGQAFERHLMTHQTTPFLMASVGCSTGQELWSVAMVLEHKRMAYAKLYNKPACEFELLGVDVSVRSLTIAKSATYNERVFREIPKTYHRFWRVVDKQWQLKDALQQKGHFIKCNVFNDQEFQEKLANHYAQKLSLVLCQNMLIYFRRFDQRDILSRITKLIKPEGLLVLGAGEGIFWQQHDMSRLNVATVNGWQKRPF